MAVLDTPHKITSPTLADSASFSNPARASQRSVVECSDQRGMGKEFDRWNERKKVLHEADFGRYVHEREVWWCALGVNIGVEADGKHENFERPVLVLRNQIGTRCSSCHSRHVPSRTRINGPSGMTAGCSQRSSHKMRLISTKRLLRKMYRMDRRIFDDIKHVVLTMIRDF